MEKKNKLTIKKVIKKIAKKFAKKSIKKAKATKVAKKIKTKLTKLKKLKKVTPKKKIKKQLPLKLIKTGQNPVLSPSYYPWESQGTFNPGSIYINGKVHLFYRALGDDGISRVGYASSDNGIDFEDRLLYPIYTFRSGEEMKKHWPFTSPARPSYDRTLYASGGGWGGCEDPRVVLIGGYIYMTFNVFNGWNSLRVAVTSIKEEDLLNKKWSWTNFSYLSKEGDRQKNWVLFPEKFNGKFAIFHNLDKGDPNRVHIAYVNKLDTSETPQGCGIDSEAPDPQILPDHIVAWHKRTRSIASPPIRTKDGWLLLYHAMDKDGSERYKLGAMLLDLENPEKVLYRAQHPILEPKEWYENDWKPGIIYANGAIVKDGRLFVYYGGGDKYIAVASIMLSELIDSIKEGNPVKLKKEKKVKSLK